MTAPLHPTWEPLPYEELLRRHEHMEKRIIGESTERSRLMAENSRLKAIIRSALDALDNGMLISSRDLTYMREVVNSGGKT